MHAVEIWAVYDNFAAAVAGRFFRLAVRLAVRPLRTPGDDHSPHRKTVNGSLDRLSIGALPASDDPDPHLTAPVI